MTTASRASAASHKRRSRRRRQDKPAISAKLVLDDHIKSDVGIVSEDLFYDLFPHLEDGMSRQAWPSKPQTHQSVSIDSMLT